jgi:hypothetical protein
MNAELGRALYRKDLRVVVVVAEEVVGCTDGDEPVNEDTLIRSGLGEEVDPDGVKEDAGSESARPLRKSDGTGDAEKVGISTGLSTLERSTWSSGLKLRACCDCCWTWSSGLGESRERMDGSDMEASAQTDGERERKPERNTKERQRDRDRETDRERVWERVWERRELGKTQQPELLLGWLVCVSGALRLACECEWCFEAGLWVWVVLWLVGLWVWVVLWLVSVSGALACECEWCFEELNDSGDQRIAWQSTPTVLANKVEYFRRPQQERCTQ